MALALVAGGLATAGAAGYNGNTVVYITGSTAFRSAANAYLYSKFGANLCATDKTTTNDSSAGNLYFSNVPASSFGGTGNVDVSVYWSGSEAGIQSACSGTNNIGLVFFDYTSITNNGANSTKLTNGAYLGVSGVSFSGSITPASTNANTIYAKGSIAFSDTAQSVSLFKNTYNGYKYTTVTGTKIGVVPMGFYAETGSGLTNISITALNQLYAQGYITGNTLTGNISDTNTAYFAAGRFPDSGTRLTALMVAKLGALGKVVQLQPNVGGGAITNVSVTAAGTVNGVAVDAANNGSSSGGTLAGYLTNGVTNSGFIANDNTGTGLSFPSVANNHVIAYIGVADVAGLSSYPGTAPTPLALNGVVGRCYSGNSKTALDLGYTNIINGAYPYWAYEYIVCDSASLALGGVGGTTAAAYKLSTNMASVIKSWNSTNNYSNLAPNIPLTEMKVSRSVDGGNIN